MSASAERRYRARVSDQPVLGRRPLTSADAAAVLDLVNAYDREFFGEPMTDLQDIQAEWQVPAFDLARDSVSLWDGPELVASAELGPRGRLEVVVAAGWRTQRLEADLLEELEDRGRQRGFPEVNRFLPQTDELGLERVRRRGYRLHHTTWTLRLDPDAPIADRQLPAGYQVRPFRPEDAAAAFAVVSDAFAEWDSGPGRSFADWEAESLRRPGVDTSNFRVATWNGTLVGTCVVLDSQGEAWVSELATHRDHRGRGVAQQLLADAYAAARQRGLLHGGLSTDTRTGALGLYLRLGMRVLHTVQNWSLALVPDVGSTGPDGLARTGPDR